MYCTQTDIMQSGIPEDDLIQLTDDNDLGAVDPDVVAKAISRADEMIDGFLRARYTVPLAEVPGLLNSLAIDLCVYFLYGHKPHVETPDRVVDSYREARADLRRIQRSEIDLGIASPTGSASSSASFVANDRLTGRDRMKGLL